MPNHSHLIAVPQSEEGLRQAIGEAHRRYTRRITFRERWRGHLWQGRFASFVMDEGYLLAAARYVELNPVRARLVAEPTAARADRSSARQRHILTPGGTTAGTRAASTETRTEAEVNELSMVSPELGRRWYSLVCSDRIHAVILRTR